MDELRQIVRVTGLPDRETAALYFTKVVNNRDLYVPLRQGNYRNFLITEAELRCIPAGKKYSRLHEFLQKVLFESKKQIKVSGLKFKV